MTMYAEGSAQVILKCHEILYMELEYTQSLVERDAPGTNHFWLLMNNKYTYMHTYIHTLTSLLQFTISYIMENY